VAAGADQEVDAMQNRRGFFGGILLVTVGMLMLLHYYGALPFWMADGAWWPLVIIAFGVWRLAMPCCARHLGSGVTFTLIGLWCLAVTARWYGLTWHNSWPLVLVAAGLGIIVRSAASYAMPPNCRRLICEERPHV
jgi:hypothetical protein